MKRKREGWATRKLPRLTIEETERHLDMLAILMTRGTKREAELLLPIWRRVQREHDALRDASDIMAAARLRFQQLSQRTAVPAS